MKDIDLDKHVTCCPKCGGTLIYEQFYQVGHQFRVKKDGTIAERWKRTEEMPDETDMLYCSECFSQFDDFGIDWSEKKIYIQDEGEDHG